MGKAARHLHFQSAKRMSADDANECIADGPKGYSLEVVCEMTGLSQEAAEHYRALGLLAAHESSADAPFTDETVRTLRLLEHLRSAFEMSDPALKLTLALLNEIDDLRSALRSYRLM